MNIAAALNLLFPAATLGVDYTLQDDGDGPYIREWNLAVPAPTAPELAAADLEVTRLKVWSEIKDERDRRSEAGCQVGGQWFHNDLKSRSQWERMANRSAALSDNDPYLVEGDQVAWKTMSGAFIPLTAGLIRQVVDAFEVQEVATFKAAEIHRAAMVGAADPLDYDYSGDWPAIYQGS